MDGRKAIEVGDRSGIPVIPLQPVDAGTDGKRGAGAARLQGGWAWFAGLVGPVVAAACIAVEPPPADPPAAEPVLATLLFLALLGSWVGAALAGARRRRQSLTWAVAVGVLSVAMTVTCPTSGHHAGIGPWWFVQLTASGGALAAALAGRRRAGGATQVASSA